MAIQQSLLSAFDLPSASSRDAKSYSSAKTLAEWIDEWSFKGAKTDVYSHKIHRYPAMFIPQLVRKLLEVYSVQGDVVLDIFNGSGSTLVETKLTSRHGIGIEINPLAVLISKVKTTKIDFKIAEQAFKKIEKEFYTVSKSKKLLDFDNIEYWFSQDVIEYLSRVVSSIDKITDADVADFFRVSLSEIIREVSWCIHSGFKMHRDVNKIEKIITKQEFFDKFSGVVEKNIRALKAFCDDSSDFAKVEIIFGDSTKRQKKIKANSIDLILTSPPYGDSQTTVAYGQFSRLSSQVLGLQTIGKADIPNLDRDLLGGRKQDGFGDLIERSISLSNVHELFTKRISLCNEAADRKKLESRLNDVMSFYRDLDLTLENGSFYLKPNKHFILVTGSRVVKMVKLHTDLIIAELAEKYGMSLSGIFYRNIENKRMPSKVSATNVTGEKAPTMTRESIVILRKA